MEGLTRLISRLTEEAKKSSCIARLASCITDGKNIFSIGHNDPNHSGRNVLQGKVYANHAEISALLAFFKEMNCCEKGKERCVLQN